MAAGDMFQDFSFEQQPAASHETERARQHLSPTAMPSEYFTDFSSSAMPSDYFTGLSPPSPLPQAGTSVGELAQILDRQSLHVELDPAYDIPVPDPAPATSKTEEVPTYSRISTASLRLQRQANARKHCNSTHIRNMSKLVEKMVAEGDQCTISEPRPPTSAPKSPAAYEDEAVDMEYNPINADDEKLYTLRFRRAGESINRLGAVTKKIRMRRHTKVTKGPSK
jgi:hypothetical protein